MQKKLVNYHECSVTLIYSLLLVSPSMFYYFAESKFTLYLIPFLMLQVLLVISPLILINLPKKWWNILSVPFFFMTIFQWANFSLFEFELTEAAILSILDTNANESSDFLNILPLGYWAFLPIAGLILYLNFRRTKSGFSNSKRTKIFLVLMISFLLAPKVLRSSSASDFIAFTKKIYPTRNILLVQDSIEMKRSYVDSLSKFQDIDIIANNKHSNQVNIIVIGESARKMSHSNYGYARNTNQYTEKIKNEITTFSNVYAASNSTIMSLKNTLTKEVENRVYTLPSIMKNAGSKSSWISNQGKYGEHLSLLSMVAATGSDSVYTNNSDFGGVSYDERVLPYLETKLKSDGSIFIIIHLLGSHFNYIRRYPKSFNYFSGQKIANKTPDQSEMINRYDNSILYTDYLLGKIIKLLKKENRPTSLVYFSDHGEILYDDQYDYYGHGGGREATKFELEIPFYIWMNEKYKTEERISFIQKYKELPLSLISFMPFYLGFVGVELPQVPLKIDTTGTIKYVNAKDELVPFVK